MNECKPAMDSRRENKAREDFSDYLTDNMTAISFFTERSIRLDTMFKTIEFPTSISNLYAYCQDSSFLIITYSRQIKSFFLPA